MMVAMEDRESRLEAVCEQVDVQKCLRLLGTDLIAGLDRMEARLDSIEAKLRVTLILAIVMAGLAWVNLIVLIVLIVRG